MDRYFARFPYTYYSNTLCVDIARRVKINDHQDAQGDLNNYYPYEIIHNMRPDQISEYYYKDAEQDWLIYLTNNIIDPYYGWYMDQNQFNSLIVQKYGSAPIAQRTILYYRNNWYLDPTQYDPSVFSKSYSTTININQTALLLKKYYVPIWGNGADIVGYKRKQVDTYQQTNMINQYTITMNSGAFANNEPVDFSVSLGTASVGQGMTIGTYGNTSTSLIIQSVSGNVVANTTNNMVITGFITNAVATATVTTTLSQTISNNEGAFWTPVTAYDWELERNDALRNINMIAAGAQMSVSQQITKKIQVNVDKSTNLTVE